MQKLEGGGRDRHKGYMEHRREIIKGCKECGRNYLKTQTSEVTYFTP